MRPIFFGAELDPPRMDVLLPAEQGEEHRIVIGVRIRRPVSSLEEAKIAALAELRAFTPTEIDLLREVSRPIDRTRILEAEQLATPGPVFAVTAVVMEPRYAGAVFCPACCRKLGQGNSPAIGYIMRCQGCQRGITITTVDGELVISLRIDGGR